MQPHGAAAAHVTLVRMSPSLFLSLLTLCNLGQCWCSVHSSVADLVQKVHG
jgi:hypothetical protein